MPNWITNKITAPKKVIQSMLNNEGQIDFTVILPFPGPRKWEGVYGEAEAAAEAITGKPLSSHPVLASFEEQIRKNIDIAKMDERVFSQFVGMLENYRFCGYLHEMEFAREEWGTKWNACTSKVNTDEGNASFDTAWSCPKELLIKVSRLHPEETIQVVYADEDIGSNCGKFTIKNGLVTEEDIAPKWCEMDEQQKQKWKSFALKVKGLEEETDQEQK